MFDLEAYDTVAASDEGYDLPLLHPKDGTPLTWIAPPPEPGPLAVGAEPPPPPPPDVRPLTVRIVGPDSALAREIDAILGNELAVKKAANEDYILTYEEQAERSLRRALHLTIGWCDGIGKAGKPLPFTPQNLREFYTRCPWAKEQVFMATYKRGLFIRGSSTPSARTSSTS